MKDCKNCVYEKGGMICMQGHVRGMKYKNLIADGYIPLEDCHAWKEKEECRWCDEWRRLNVNYHGTPFWKALNYLITFSDSLVTECPKCGKKL